jgi:hypothetical protein
VRAVEEVNSQSSKLQSPRLFIQEKNTNMEFLIDTGSEVSILPYWYIKKPQISVTYVLSAANNTPIKSCGLQEIVLNLGLPKNYQFNFIVADIKTPILGADFLQKFNLLPDLSRRRLIESSTLCSIQCKRKFSGQSSIHLIDEVSATNSQLRELLRRYPSLRKAPQYMDNPPHTVHHCIETTGPPIYHRCRRLAKDIGDKVKWQRTSGIK